MQNYLFDKSLDLWTILVQTLVQPLGRVLRDGARYSLDSSRPMMTDLEHSWRHPCRMFLNQSSWTWVVINTAWCNVLKKLKLKNTGNKSNQNSYT